MTSRIAYTKPSITELEQNFAADAVANGWGSRCYEYINRFEQDFSTYLQVSHAIATSSCTGAMHMGLDGLGIGPGDEVILADTNWIATVAPIHHLGATPVFVDIDPESWCIDPARAEDAITPRTKAIIATHLYGNLCDLDRLSDIAARHGLALIEDAAEAIGSMWKEKRAGSVGTFSTFSFHGTKTLTTGEGGMFLTSDAELYERVLTLSNHGRSRSQKKQFWPDMVGYKFKMSNVQAAIGCAQLARIAELVARKREILAYYKDALYGFEGVTMNPEPDGTSNGAWMPTVVIDKSLGIACEHLLEAFSAANIDARVFFHPLSKLDFFQSVPGNQNAWDIPTRAINLPSYHDLTDRELSRVTDVVTGLLRSAGR